MQIYQSLIQMHDMMQTEPQKPREMLDSCAIYYRRRHAKQGRYHTVFYEYKLPA